ncbi:MAG TPA: carboxypeptidase regulatory-like domain-containing protein [Methylomirabilota bacterium]|nr:carboxypeptidase regulatory-like domain-containing protein [Methylomirabilota bacterium]
MDFNLPQPPPPKTNWFSSHHFLAYIFVISAIGAIVSVLYYRQVANQYIDTTPITHKDATANWKTYTNDKYGFSFKYPMTLRITKQDSAEIDFKKDVSTGMAVQILNNPNQLVINDWLNQNSDYYSKSEAIQANLEAEVGFQYKDKEIKIAGLDGLEQELDGEGATIYNDFFVKDKNIYIVSLASDAHFYNQDQLLKDYSQILSTFKFTDSTSATQTGTLKGHVTIGPFCPVEQADNPCPGPSDAYTSREIIVYAQDKKTEVIKNFLDANGNYSFNIPAGTYWVLITPGGMQDEPLHEITITANQTTTLDFNLDTGIR